MSQIHVFNHHAMATQFQVRIADEDKTYAAQTAQAAFALTDQLEAHLSRFRASSDIAQISQLAPGDTVRVSEPVFACLELAKKMELATCGAFSIAPPPCNLSPSRRNGPCKILPCVATAANWNLISAPSARVLPSTAWPRVLREWSCPKFLLVAGGSSTLAGDAPAGMPGWSCGLGDDHAPQRYWLKNASLSGSGPAVKGEHILDPRTGQPARRQNRAWALCDTAAESDALSTACMVLDESEITEILASEKSWLVFLEENHQARVLGDLRGPHCARNPRTLISKGGDSAHKLTNYVVMRLLHTSTTCLELGHQSVHFAIHQYDLIG